MTDPTYFLLYSLTLLIGGFVIGVGVTLIAQHEWSLWRSMRGGDIDLTGARPKR